MGPERATGSGSSWREPMARREPAGSRTASSATMSWHSRLTRASAWSMTMATGASIEAMTDPSRATSARPAPGDGQGPEGRGPDRLDAVERDGQVREQDGGIVVAVVDGQPGHPGRVRRRPLRQHRRLAVPRGSDDRDHGPLARTEQALDDGGAVDDAGSDRRGGELRLVELEGERPPTSMCPCGGRASTAGGPCRHETDGTPTGRGVRQACTAGTGALSAGWFGTTAIHPEWGMPDRWGSRRVERSADRVLGASWASKPSSWLPRPTRPVLLPRRASGALCGEPPRGSLGDWPRPSSRRARTDG